MKSWILSNVRGISVGVALVVCTYTGFVSADLYDYFMGSPSEIVVTTLEHYAIDEISIKKQATGWKSLVLAINMRTGQTESGKEYEFKNGQTEIVTFTGQSVEEVYTKAVTWIKISRIK